MLKNKKGVGFPEMFIIMVLIALPFLCIAVQTQLNASERTIGVQQIPFIKANEEIKQVLYELDEDAKDVFGYSLISLARRNGFFYSSCGGYKNMQTFGDCTIINLKNDSDYFCFPDLTFSLNKHFSVAKTHWFRKNNIILKDNEFELYVDGNHIRGIPLKSESFLLASLVEDSDVVGKVSFRPVFSFNTENELNLYPEIFHKIKTTYEKCKYERNITLCFQNSVKNFDSSDKQLDWLGKSIEDVFYFGVLFNDFFEVDISSGIKSKRSVCYGLYMPESIEPEI